MNIFEFSRLSQKNQGFSFPVLIELKHPENHTWYFTSNKDDIEYHGNIFKSVPMQYKFPSSRDGIPQGGTLEIDLDQQSDDQELLEWFNDVDDNAYVNVAALINEQGEISPLSQITQRNGSVTCDGSKISWALGTDDRMNMQVNPYIFDNEALMG